MKVLSEHEASAHFLRNNSASPSTWTIQIKTGKIKKKKEKEKEPSGLSTTLVHLNKVLQSSSFPSWVVVRFICCSSKNLAEQQQQQQGGEKGQIRVTIKNIAGKMKQSI